MNGSTTTNGVPYNYNIWWQDGCESSVGTLNVYQPLANTPDVNCLSLMLDSYKNCVSLHLHFLFFPGGRRDGQPAVTYEGWPHYYSEIGSRYDASLFKFIYHHIIHYIYIYISKKRQGWQARDSASSAKAEQGHTMSVHGRFHPIIPRQHLHRF